VSYVIGLNTLGQDREFTQEEIQFALQAVQMFKERWEDKEKMNLEGDIIMRLDQATKDKKYKEAYEALDNAELDKQVEEELSLVEEVDLALLDEEAKSVYVNKAKLTILTRQFYITEDERQRLKVEAELKAKREAELAAQKALEHPPENVSSGKRHASKAE
jgi:phage terminase large subunit-like protein